MIKGHIKSPVMTLIWICIVVYFFIWLTAVLVGCGARKSQVEISKAKVEEKGQGKEENKEVSQTESSTENKSKDSADKSDENYTKRIEELYNENGQLIKRITELSKQKSTDKSVKTQSSSQSSKSLIYRITTKKYWYTKTITIKQKSKQIETNNNALYICIAFLGGLVILLGYLYYKERGKVKKIIPF